LAGDVRRRPGGDLGPKLFCLARTPSTLSTFTSLPSAAHGYGCCDHRRAGGGDDRGSGDDSETGGEPPMPNLHGGIGCRPARLHISEDGHMKLTWTILVAAMLSLAGAATEAFQAIPQKGEMVRTSATIQQIDVTKRLVTFKNADGTEDTVVAGPEVKRFSELKVGDKVNLTYYESKVFNIRKPGEPPLAIKSGTAVTGTAGQLPGGTVAAQTIRTVTVQAVDPTAGSITVKTDDGRTIVRKVDNKRHLEGVKIGDQVDIVTTEALLVNVER
jgi:hypothetical protein